MSKWNLGYLETVELFNYQPDNKKDQIREFITVVLNKYKVENDKWTARKMVYTSQQVCEKLFNKDTPVSAADALDLIRATKSNYPSIIAQQTLQTLVTATTSNQFSDNYLALMLQGWSAVDEYVWDGFKYTIIDEESVIVAPTGNGNEYKVVGKTYNEVYGALAGLAVEGSNVNRLKYIEQNIINYLLEVCFQNDVLSDAAVNGERLSGAVADLLYQRIPVTDATTGQFSGWKLGYKDGKPTVERYIKCANERFLSNPDNYIANISTVSNDSDEPTFRYISLDLKDGDWSAYKKWFKDTFENPEMVAKVFMTFVAGVVKADNTSKQVLWITGRGNDGKSQILNALSDFMGSAWTNVDSKIMAGDFGMSQLVNKRLVTISDQKNSNLIRSPWIHQLTGADRVLVNAKNKRPYTAKLIGKLIVCENILPTINLNEDNQSSRLILLKCKDKTAEEKIAAGTAVMKDGLLHDVGNAIWPKELISQAEAFIFNCLKIYPELCPNNSQIIVPKELQDLKIDVCSDIEDEDLADIIFDYLEIGGPNDYVLKSDLFRHIEEKLGKKYHKFNTPNQVRLLLSKVYGTSERQNRIDGKPIRIYRGVKLKAWEGGQSSFKQVTNQPKQPTSVDLQRKYITTREEPEVDTTIFDDEYAGLE